ncbi:MAG: hypothetical protein LBS05_07695 [Tannerellaceae bacterium]|jgi:hypothetical protein|nr:hypothetical protein [Tannerellaceae bacterium]
MSKHFFWKIWLRSNVLTQEVDNDPVAEVSTGTIIPLDDPLTENNPSRIVCQVPIAGTTASLP